MVKHRFQSIADQGGMLAYLESTRKLHNGLGYSDLQQRLKLHVSKKQICIDFGISYTTLTRSWLAELSKESKGGYESLS